MISIPTGVKNRRRTIWILGSLVCFSLIVILFSLSSIPTQIYLSSLRYGDLKNLNWTIRQLKSPISSVRSSAAQGLGQIGPGARTAVPELLLMLQDQSPDVVSSAAWALGHIEMRSPDPDVIAALRDCLKHPDGEARRYAAYALSLCGGGAAAAVEDLIDKLDDPHMGCWAAQALGEIGPAARVSIPQLATLLKSQKSADRMNAAMALSKLQPLPDDVLAEIKDLLFDPDPLVRDFAKKASESIVSAKMGSRATQGR